MKYFDFFGSPRELRDRIYVELAGKPATVSSRRHGPGRKGNSDLYLQLEFSAPFKTSMLLVSSQFSHEYQEELQRHVVLGVGSLPFKDGQVVSLPIHRGIKKQMGTIQHLRSQVTHGRGSDRPDTSEDYDHLHNGILEKILEYLPSLRDIKPLVVLHSDEFDFAGTDEDSWNQTLLRGSEKLRQRPTKAKIIPNILFLSELHTSCRAYQPTAEEMAQHPGLQEWGWEGFCYWMDGLQSNNYMLCRARPTESEYSFHGFEITPVRCGSYDSEEMMEIHDEPEE